jgi:hypothetical protein
MTEFARICKIPRVSGIITSGASNGKSVIFHLHVHQKASLAGDDFRVSFKICDFCLPPYVDPLIATKSCGLDQLASLRLL